MHITRLFPMQNLNLLISNPESILWQIVILFLSVFIGLTIGMLVKLIASKYSKALIEQRPATASALGGIARTIAFLSFSVGLFYGVRTINLGAAEEFVLTGSAVLCTLAAALMAFMLVEAPTLWLVKHVSKTSGTMDDMLAQVISKSLKATVVIFAIVQVAQILSGKEISSLLAGLGIGGLAFALAAQDTIKNFFGSLVLLADKPFKIGERIQVGGYDGPVEEVGLRSTRIRTLEGHLVTVPNGEMANKLIQNIGKRPHIRRIFDIGLTYDTPPEKVAEAKSILEELLKEHPGMDPEYPPRVFFNEFKDSALNLVCFYWYHPARYWDYMAFTEDLNLKILERLNAAEIEFAFPTQTVHLKQAEGSQAHPEIS